MWNRVLCSGWAAVALLFCAPAWADDVLLCIRGKSYETGREFLQTRQLKFRAEGPALGDLLPLVVSRAVRERLWPDLKSTEVHVAPFDSQLCGNEPLAELSLVVTATDLEVVQAESSRGPDQQPKLEAMARSATSRPAAEKLAPAGTAAGAKRHDWFRLYYVTTRRPSGSVKATEAFSAERNTELKFGAVDVSIPADHRWAKLESPSVLRLEWDANPERHVTIADTFQPLLLPAWKADLARRAVSFDKGGVLFFIHGYNNSFEDAAKRAAQLAYDLAFPGPTVLFSWPSDGNPLGYVRDEEKAKTAWREVADVLDNLTNLGPNVPIYVVAHSMGNRLLSQGLAELLRRRPAAVHAFRQVILASPDIGDEEFRQRWVYDLKSPSGPRYTLYASNQDIPVALSAWLHGERRLGSGGTDITVLPGLDSVDASGITEEWFGLSHSYFGDNATVMSDLFLVIHQGLEPRKRPRLVQSRGTRGEYWDFRR